MTKKKIFSGEVPNTLLYEMSVAEHTSDSPFQREAARCVRDVREVLSRVASRIEDLTEEESESDRWSMVLRTVVRITAISLGTLAQEKTTPGSELTIAELVATDMADALCEQAHLVIKNRTTPAPRPN